MEESRTVHERLREQLRAVSSNVVELAEWIKLPGTLELASEFLSLHEIEPSSRHARRMLALVYMSNDSDGFFDDSAEDKIMMREAKRLNAVLKKQLKRGAAEEGESFSAAFTRAVRFHAAWASHDVPKQAAQVDAVVERLGQEVMVQRSEQARQGGDPEPPEELLQQLRLIGGEEAEAAVRAQFLQPWQPIAVPDLEARVREVATQAMWDAIKEQVAAGEYGALFGVLGEMQQALVTLVAHSEREREDFLDKFDAKFIEQQVTHGVLETQDVHELISYLVNTIRGWQAAADDADAAEWAAQVEATLDGTKDMPLPQFIVEHLLGFLPGAFARIGRIYQRILEFGESMRREREQPSGLATLADALA